jgi:hypothetical protein
MPRDLEYDYYNDYDNIKWITEYPLIKKYNDAWNVWDYNKDKKYDNEDYLRKCPLCRK